MNIHKLHPGEYLLSRDEIEINAGRKTALVLVANTGDRPIQVGSHFHFYEVNKALRFDRAAAYGMRLHIAAGTAMRFEPGEQKEAPLVEFAGARIIHGHNGLVNGPLQGKP
jgi:urease beta subunit